MDKKSKIFLVIFFLLIIGSVGATYWRIMIKKDYIIEAQTDCDPTVDKCFIWECDPASTVDGEACTGDSESDIWYYQIVRRNANMIPLCDPNNEECLPLECTDGEKDCSVAFCDEINKESQEIECNDPVQYNIDNPVEEEAVECEEGDTECEAALEEETTACEEGDEECLAAEEENATAVDCDPETEDCAVGSTDVVDSETDAATDEQIQGSSGAPQGVIMQ